MPYFLSLLPGSKVEQGVGVPVVEPVVWKEALNSKGEIRQESEGSYVWQFGGIGVGLGFQLNDDEELLEIEVSFPLNASKDDLSQAVEVLVDKCEEMRFRVFDPQLGCPLTRGEVFSLLFRYEQVSDYHSRYSSPGGEVGGFSEIVSTSNKSPFPSIKVKALVVFFLVLLIAFGVFRVLVFDAFDIQSNPSGEHGLERPPGPPPGWLDRHQPN